MKENNKIKKIQKQNDNSNFPLFRYPKVNTDIGTNVKNNIFKKKFFSKIAKKIINILIQ